MALIRRINERDRYWMRNRQPYVEPTEEQKQLEAVNRLERLQFAKEFEMRLATVFGTINRMAPGALERTHRMMGLK